MAKNMEVALLYDCYGELLTDKQRDMIEQYYHQDLSLSEIAENAGISRQGVRDSVKRAEVQLFDMEERIGLDAEMRAIHSTLETMSRYSAAIRAKSEALGTSEITDDAVRLAELIDTLKDRIL